jgi:hypothetical protein
MDPATFLTRLEATPAYALIAARYRGKFARRSGLPYVNHIREGAYLLALTHGWDDDLLAAFCLHPVFQSDGLLAALLSPAEADDLARIPPRVIVLGMEYRRVANAYTIKDPVRTPERIELGPLEEVAHLLAADKVQNKKDFLKHIAGAHDRASYRRATEHSVAYFDSWLARLGVPPERYEWGAAQAEKIAARYAPSACQEQ